jgi:eukaryotic-like serine/threonine-protein kinase
MTLESGHLGAYRILKPLGEGGMGIVYRAHDARLDRHVAIKVLSPAMAADPDARERLRREALAAAALDHPYICKVFEIGEDQGNVFLVLEFVPGETLHDRLRHGPLSLPEALRIAGEVAEALEEAHTRRFLHRDLKPANIMLSANGHVKVMDFGLARRMEDAPLDPGATCDGSTRGLGSQLTVPGAILGTPDYMSPEQVRGEELDARSDQFSFGIILAEMLSGGHPFRRPSTVETLAAVLRETPEIHGDIPQPLMVLVRRTLAKVPEQRFDSMAAVRAEMHRLTASSGTIAGVSTPDRLSPIGRDAELRILTRHLDEALAGRGSLILIGGEPGIGKTCLISALADAARLRGALVLTGHCYEAEGSPPYTPFIEMLETSIRHGSRDTLRFSLGEEAPEIARILPELRQMYPDIPPALDLPPDQQRRFLFNAYRAFVERVSRLTPVVSVFEDLHWADEPTLLLLEHLAKSVSEIPRLFIATYRDTDLEVGRPFARTLESLIRQKLATRIVLRRLPVAGVEQMLAALSAQKPPQSLARVVFEETEGNPFFVEEVFRHLSEEGMLFDNAGAFLTDLRVDQLQVPEGVRLVLGRRLGRLSDDARRILTTAAVIGRIFPLELLEALQQTSPEKTNPANSNPDACLDAIEEAEHAHLVEAEPSGRQARYRFVHELVRQTLAETLSLPRRQRLHARVAEAMERVYASSIDAHVSALAHHLYEAGAAVPADKAIHYLTEAAARASAAAAFEEALGLIDNALSLVEDERSAISADLHELRGNCLLSMGRGDEATSSLERAMAIFEALGDYPRFMDAVYRLYSHYSWSMQLAKLDQVPARIASAAASGPPELRFFLLACQAGAAGMNCRIDEALALLDAMDGIRQESFSPRIRLFAAIADRSVRTTSGQFALAEASAKQVLSLLDPQRDLWLVASNDYGLFMAPALYGRLAEAQRIATESIARAARVGHFHSRFSALSTQISIAFAAGDLDAAESLGRESIAFGQTFPCGLLFIAHSMLGIVLTYRLRTDEALQALEKGTKYAAAYMAGTPESQLALGLAAAGRDPSAAVAAALTHIGKPGVSRSFGAWSATLYLTEALAIAGRTPQAAALLPIAKQIAAEWVANFTGFPVLTAAGIAAAGAGDFARSEQHHRASLARMDASEYVTGRVFARVWYADMLLARNAPGDPASARTLLTEALAQAEAIGLALYARLARERLALL